MDELFRVRIAAKRQMTVPQRMMNVLDLDEGDELQFTVRGKDILKTVPCKSVPVHLVTEEVAAAIAESRREAKQHKTGDDLAKRVRERNAHQPEKAVRGTA